ncbi:MAG: methionyl-tRNA formyltransferase [Eubacteriales bacterium]|nr:methionyl-tRNA formyltransferase [Eubacteriales bacterium]
MDQRSSSQPIELSFSSPAQLSSYDFRPATEEDKTKRVLYFGSPEFSLPPLRLLHEQGYKLVGVVTQPDRPVGRKQVLTPTPTKALAEDLGLNVYQWAKLNEDGVREELEALKPDLIVTSAYGNLLPKWLLDLPTFGPLNIHPSLLPNWRGASPIASSLLAGDRETALSIIKMGVGLDDGDIVASCRYPISDEEDQESLSRELAELSAELLLAILPYWYAGELKLTKQSEAEATYAKKLTREDGLLDFQHSARANFNRVRALYPWPGAYTYYDGKRYKVYRAHVEDKAHSHKPGEVVRADDRLLVACSDGLLSLDLIQGPNGKKVAGSDCYHNFAPGNCFGSNQL